MFNFFRAARRDPKTSPQKGTLYITESFGKFSQALCFPSVVNELTQRAANEADNKILVMCDGYKSGKPQFSTVTGPESRVTIELGHAHAGKSLSDLGLKVVLAPGR